MGFAVLDKNSDVYQFPDARHHHVVFTQNHRIYISANGLFP